MYMKEEEKFKIKMSCLLPQLYTEKQPKKFKYSSSKIGKISQNVHVNRYKEVKFDCNSSK